MAPLHHNHCLQLVPKARQVRHLLQVLQHLQVQYWEQDKGSNIECRSGAHNLHPICLSKNKSLVQKLAQIGFSSWCKLASVHLLAVYCAKAVLVGSTLTMWKQTKKSANFYLQGLVAGTVILAQYP